MHSLLHFFGRLYYVLRGPFMYLLASGPQPQIAFVDCLLLSLTFFCKKRWTKLSNYIHILKIKKRFRPTVSFWCLFVFPQPRTLIFLAVYDTPLPHVGILTLIYIPSNFLQHWNFRPPSPLKYSDVFYAPYQEVSFWYYLCPAILFKDSIISPHFDLLTSLKPIYLKYRGFKPNILQNPKKLLIFMVQENYFL